MAASRPVRRVAGVFTGTVLAAGLLPAYSAAANAAPSRPADNGARIVAEQRIDARTIDLTVRSPAVGGPQKVRVQFPKGWRRKAKRTWPVVYLYGGGGGDDHTIWAQKTDVEQLAARWNTIVVMPFNGRVGGFVDWWNYGKRGVPRWEAFHTLEVRQLVERNLRGGTSRAVMGVSAGGLGAMAYAGRHPGLFKHVSSFSAVLHTRKAGVPPVLMLLNSGDGNDPYRIWGVPGVDDRNWRAHDPYELAGKLRGTGLYVSSGTTGRRGPLDPTNLTWQQAVALRLVGGVSEQLVGASSRSFVTRLGQLKVPVTTHFYADGWHSWAYWQVEMHRAWPRAMKAIGARKV